MLGHANWRVQLVAAAAMIIGDSVDCQDALWAALDRPCWTSPQLAVAAALVDVDFLNKARMRLERRCTVSSEPAATLSAIERHVAMGPASSGGHSVKLFSALLALCQEMGAPWVASLEAEQDVEALLAADVDDGGENALDWKQEISALKERIS